jgi:prephenate dehydrogenase
MTSYAEASPRALVVGVGLIGGSIGFGLRAAGWHVSGIDVDPQRASEALERGAIDIVGEDAAAELIVVATPAGAVVDLARDLLARHDGPQVIVTDVAGIKGAITEAIDDPRFVGGHPMAGSELLGLEGARPDLFVGATWVVTPREQTPPTTYARLVGVLRTLGATALALPADVHDRLVARVSHVPHLVAASLMNQATEAASDDAALLQLAAGGFRDMTRIAAGAPGIWPDVCIENREAILEALDELVGQLNAVRSALESSEGTAIFDLLSRASRGRQSLPGGASSPERLAEVLVPVPDRPGVIAEVAQRASDLGISVFDVEIAHSAEGGAGVLILVVAEEVSSRFAESLRGIGYHCTVNVL